DRGSVALNLDYGLQLFCAKRYDDAVAQLRETIKLNPNYPATHLRLGEILWTMGKHEEALTAWDRFGEVWSSSGNWKEVHEAYRQGGVAAFWLRMLEDYKGAAARKEDKGKWFPPMNFVWAYAALGDLDNAFKWVDKACEDRQPLLMDVIV